MSSHAPQTPRWRGSNFFFLREPLTRLGSSRNLERAKKIGHPVVIAGSLFVVAEAMKALRIN